MIATITTMPALSIRQPWAWLILNGYKDVENRSWTAHVRGTIAIHASKSNTKKEYESALATIAKHKLEIELPSIEELPVGGLVGTVEIVDCLEFSPSPWWIEGNYAFTLKNAVKGDFVSLPGQQGFFTVDYPKPRFFGVCGQCESGILIPGLDAYHCCKCGVVRIWKPTGNAPQVGRKGRK